MASTCCCTARRAALPISALGAGFIGDGVDGFEQQVDALGLAEGVLLCRLQLVLDFAAPLHGLLGIGKVLVADQLGADALEDGDGLLLPLGQIRRGDHAGHFDAQGRHLVRRAASGHRLSRRRRVIGHHVSIELSPAGHDLGAQLRVRGVPAVALFDQLIAGPLRRHEQHAFGAADHGLVFHLHLVVQRQAGVAAVHRHRQAQVVVERLVLERLVLQQGQAVEAGRELAVHADAGVKLLANDLLGQRPRQVFEAVAVGEALQRGSVVLDGRAGGELAQQLAAGLVRAAAHHCRRVAGVEVGGAVLVPRISALNQVHGKHAQYSSAVWVRPPAAAATSLWGSP
ncbi:hypothetical protein G6F65_016073 [Rhizopus arrhizus]|nr:hypothetical protein G6F65_016073 [Rhizopus arrhizus]